MCTRPLPSRHDEIGPGQVEIGAQALGVTSRVQDLAVVRGAEQAERLDRPNCEQRARIIGEWLQTEARFLAS